MNRARFVLAIAILSVVAAVVAISYRHHGLNAPSAARELIIYRGVFTSTVGPNVRYQAWITDSLDEDHSSVARVIHLYSDDAPCRRALSAYDDNADGAWDRLFSEGESISLISQEMTSDLNAGMLAIHARTSAVERWEWTGTAFMKVFDADHWFGT